MAKLTNEELIARAEARRESVLEEVQAQSARLPLRFLRQQAQYTTPASNYKLAEKAASQGFAPVERILAKYDISLDLLAERLQVPLAALEDLLNDDPHAPLVMIDGEDAQALNDEVVQRGRENAVRIFREADWGPTLRFYRPSGLSLPYCVGDLVTVLTQVQTGSLPSDYALDGIIFPKIEQPAEIDWLCDLLDTLESQLGLPPNHIRLQILVESASAAINLPDLARRALPRLAGLIFGIADYSADLALPAIHFDHPIADWARAQVVNVASAVKVPAIDAMTVNYPVADPSLSEADNRERILSRLKECYDDALHGIKMGMKGKWVGHPAQLYVVLLAYRQSFSSEVLGEELHKIKVYHEAVREQIGATIIDGVMSDRATDRHARARLREAIALGLLSPEEGLSLGVVTAEEAAELRDD